MIHVRQMQLSFLLQWEVRLCQAQPNGKWSWTPKTLFACLGSKNECFYSNVNSSMFKGLKLVKSRFWQAVLRTWIDNNHVNSTSSGCTLLWNNRNVACQGHFLFFTEWVRAGVMIVADMVTSEGNAPYQTVCRLVGRAPKRILQYNVSRAAVCTFLHSFDIKV